MIRRLIITATSVVAIAVVLGAAAGSASATDKTCSAAGTAIGFGIYTPAACEFPIKCLAVYCNARVSLYVGSYFPTGRSGSIKGAGQSRLIPRLGSTNPTSAMAQTCFTSYGIIGSCGRTWYHLMLKGDQLVVSCRAPVGLLPIVRFASPTVGCSAYFYP